jgi:ketosteroid isomerase-like protein
MPEASEFATQVYGALNADDREAVRKLSDPELVIGTTVEAYRGRDALLAWFDEGADAFDDFTVEVLEVEEISGHVLISVLQRGRGRTSGAEVDHPFVHVWTLRDGRGTTLRSFADRDDAVRYAEGGEET